MIRQPAACEHGAPNRTVVTLKRGPFRCGLNLAERLFTETLAAPHLVGEFAIKFPEGGGEGAAMTAALHSALVCREFFCPISISLG